MAELVAILDAMRESEYNERKFMAAMQGVDLDKQTGRRPKPEKAQQKKATTMEDIQARAVSGGRAKDANDILSLQGALGAKHGFQLGKDMDYGSFTDGAKDAPKNLMDF
jgi:hypothetical protein